MQTKILKTHCRPILGFFSKWFLLGLIMMLLNATIWPEISTSPATKWIYEVSVLWFSVINHICEPILPYLQDATIWLKDFLVNSFKWLESSWPHIVNCTTSAFKWYLNTVLLFLAISAFGVIIFCIYMLIIFFKDREEFWRIFHQIIKNTKKKLFYKK